MQRNLIVDMQTIQIELFFMKMVKLIGCLAVSKITIWQEKHQELI